MKDRRRNNPDFTRNTRSVTEGRLTNAQKEKQKIELQEKINFQEVAQLNAKHEGEKIKTSIAWAKTDLLEADLDIQEIRLDEKHLDKQIATTTKNLKQIELGVIEDKLQIASVSAELEHEKSIKQLEGLSIDIDELEFKNEERKSIGESFGVRYTQRAFPVQKIKNYLKGDDYEKPQR